MLLVRFFIMRFASTLLAALGIAAVCLPARAQEKVTRLDYGFSYVIPNEYRIDTDRGTSGLGDSPIALTIKEGTTTRTLSENASGYTNLSILSAIRLVILPATQSIISGDDSSSSENRGSISEEEARRFVETLNMATKRTGTTLDYQKSAMIKVSGQDAAVVRCNGFSERLNEAFTARLILLPRKGKLYLFIFGAVNAEFEEKVGAFDKFMKSFKFLTPPGARPTPAPKKPKAKK
jgi:hypothetical protein